MCEFLFENLEVPAGGERFWGELTTGKKKASSVSAPAPLPTAAAASLPRKQQKQKGKKPSSSNSLSPSMVASRVAEAVARVAGRPVPPSAPLSDEGIDSLGAVELRNELAAALGLSGPAMPATLAYDHPSVEALTAWAVARLRALGRLGDDGGGGGGEGEEERDDDSSSSDGDDDDVDVAAAAAAGGAAAAEETTTTAPPPAPLALLPPAPPPPLRLPVENRVCIFLDAVSGRLPAAPDLAAAVAASGSSSSSPASLWSGDAASVVPPERWDADAALRSLPSSTSSSSPPSTSPPTSTRFGSFLRSTDLSVFDAAAHGIPGAEAAAMDPQQRLLLEDAWALVEGADYYVDDDLGAAFEEGGSGGNGTARRRRSRVTSVVVGVARLCDDELVSSSSSSGSSSTSGDPYGGTSRALSVVAGRLSYVHALRGPCLTLDTACSSSLAAAHVAAAGLRARCSGVISLCGPMSVPRSRS